MSHGINRQILLIEKPTGKLGPEHFKLSDAAIPEPKDGEALLRVRYISLDAANRAWLHGATYRAAVETNTVMAGGGIAEVVSSKAEGLAPGDIVFADTGWQDYAALPARHLTRMLKIEPIPSAQCLRHRGTHRLFRIARDRQAQGRRDCRGVGGRRLGRFDRRPDRWDQGLPCRRHCRRQGQMPLAHLGTRLRCRRRLSNGVPKCAAIPGRHQIESVGVQRRHQQQIVLFRMFSKRGLLSVMRRYANSTALCVDATSFA